MELTIAESLNMNELLVTLVDGITCGKLGADAGEGIV